MFRGGILTQHGTEHGRNGRTNVRRQHRPRAHQPSQIGVRFSRQHQPFAAVFRRIGCNFLCN